MNVDAQSAMTFLAAFVMLQLVIKVVDYFWTKLTKSGSKYVTRTYCKGCAKNGDEAVQALSTEILHVKQILLMIGIQLKIPEEKLVALISVDDRG